MRAFFAIVVAAISAPALAGDPVFDAAMICKAHQRPVAGLPFCQAVALDYPKPKCTDALEYEPAFATICPVFTSASGPYQGAAAQAVVAAHGKPLN